MCGIWAILSADKSISPSVKLHDSFMSISARGPENYKLKIFGNSLLGFHRLAIMDTNHSADQPFIYEDDEYKYILICNGEIYNYKVLYKTYLEGLCKLTTCCDCEVLLHLFIQQGRNITCMFPCIRGEFACVFGKINKETGREEYIIMRDMYGVRPMFYAKTDSYFYLSSELKGLNYLPDTIACEQIPTSSIAYLSSENGKFKLDSCWYKFPVGFTFDTLITNEEFCLKAIRDKFIDAVRVRSHSDRPICCLLSGGIDSSLVASILQEGIRFPINTYTITTTGGGEDTKYANIVAKHIGSNHTNVELTFEEALNSISNVIYAIESWDVTTVRASIWQYLVAEYISKNTSDKCVFCGDGSDEVHGSYLYLQHAPNADEFDIESKNLLKYVHYFDGLRADRATSCHGLELRVPFLDNEYVELYMSIPREKRFTKPIEKELLRKAFSAASPITGRRYLPDEVLWRKKDAFSDSTSTVEKPWYQIIKDYIDTIVTDEEYSSNKDKFTYRCPGTKEAYYYRKIFEENYPGRASVIPHPWTTKWMGDSSEPSARALNLL